jgi:hypothetical protein
MDGGMCGTRSQGCLPLSRGRSLCSPPPLLRRSFMDQVRFTRSTKRGQPRYYGLQRPSIVRASRPPPPILRLPCHPIGGSSRAAVTTDQSPSSAAAPTRRWRRRPASLTACAATTWTRTTTRTWSMTTASEAGGHAPRRLPRRCLVPQCPTRHHARMGFVLGHRQVASNAPANAGQWRMGAGISVGVVLCRALRRRIEGEAPRSL